MLKNSTEEIPIPVNVIKRDPQAAKEAKEKGNGAWKIGDVQSALVFYNDAIKFDPQPEYFRNRAAVNIVLEHFPEALADAKEGIRLEDSSKSYFRLAEVFFFMGMAQRDTQSFEGAVSSFNQALEKEPVDEVKHALEKAEYYLTWSKVEASLQKFKKTYV